ncbi:hypothetical protein Shyhy01_66290 [Streptomyces hygroscopicus subsp. hygroscopicus]|nr:hypothetical protein Shyhy01_66290 [Streptomyces hygroscopicus subsp. hygroscopicus]
MCERTAGIVCGARDIGYDRVGDGLVSATVACPAGPCPPPPPDAAHTPTPVPSATVPTTAAATAVRFRFTCCAVARRLCWLTPPT